MGFRQSRNSFLGGPYKKDYNSFESMLGFPDFGKLLYKRNSVLQGVGFQVGGLGIVDSMFLESMYLRIWRPKPLTVGFRV